MERLFYFPDRTPFVTPPGVVDAAIPTRDGLTLHGWYVPARGVSGRGPAVLFCHGNAGNVSSHAGYADWLAERGYHVLVFDYRGYGRSDAPRRELSRADLLVDAHAALDWLLARPEVDGARIGVYGYSLGSPVALALAAERPEARAVVSMAGFATWQSIATAHVPLLGQLLIRPGMDATESAARLGGRALLVLHPGRDEIVPVSHAAKIEAAARGAGVHVETYISPGTTHNEAPFDDPEISERIGAFLGRNLGGGGG